MLYCITRIYRYTVIYNVCIYIYYKYIYIHAYIACLKSFFCPVLISRCCCSQRSHPTDLEILIARELETCTGCQCCVLAALLRASLEEKAVEQVSSPFPTSNKNLQFLLVLLCPTRWHSILKGCEKNFKK